MGDSWVKEDGLGMDTWMPVMVMRNVGPIKLHGGLCNFLLLNFVRLYPTFEWDLEDL